MIMYRQTKEIGITWKICLWGSVWAVAMGAGISNIECPAECSCLGSLVECNNLMLVGAPNRLPPWTEKLTLGGNNFANLEFNSLSRLPKLLELDVSSNKLGDNFSLSLSDEAQLKWLKLNKNHLTAIPDLKLAFLTHLFLSHNAITEINGEILQHYGELQNLDLTANRITVIHSGSFLSPNKLKLLVLNMNQISTIKSNALQNLTSLQELRLNKNHLTSLKDFLKNMDKLRILEVNKNELRQIEALTFKDLKNLEKLRLKRNKIEVLNDGAFWPLGNLIELQLDYNNLLNVSKGALFGLSNVRLLTLSHNKINCVQHQAWESHTEVLELDLSHNDLNTIDHNTFAYLKKLKKLALDDNSITTIEGAFKDLINLQVLDLNSNKISYIVEDVGNVFSALTQLQKLGIAFNHIKSINKNAFTGLSMLMELDLTGNNITSIQENAFLPLKGLNALKMNTMHPTMRLGESLFTNCPKVTI